MSKVTVKRGPEPVVRNRILIQLLNEGRSTLSDLDTTNSQIRTMVDKGYVRPLQMTRPTGGRGRPASLYVLTPKGRRSAQKVTS